MKLNILIISSVFSFLCFMQMSLAIQKDVSERKAEINVSIDQIDPSNFTDEATLQSLNKITAKTKILEVKVGEMVEFGKLDILVHKCWKAPLYEKPENKILLEILQRKADGDTEILFYGWMFSSSPSISSLEHPIYDITALECINTKKK
jgi:hypothetical protein